MNENLDEIKSFYREAFQTLDSRRPMPEIEVEFYPYIGINHTIRVRSGKVFVRLAEICREMPMPAQRALAYILVSKLLRKKMPPRAREIYSSFIKTDEIRDRAVENKRTRGRKIITSARGDVYDLDEIFDALNHDYFKNSLPKPVLSWSSRRTYRILGHHDSTHETVIVSKSLDDPKVPQFVVEYVVFHEMLHIFHPTEHRNGRRFNHTPAFRRNERRFQYFEAAEDWIERNVKHLKRRAKISRR
jgi:hypothetical protein